MEAPEPLDGWRKTSLSEESLRSFSLDPSKRPGIKFEPDEAEQRELPVTERGRLTV
jgi:hypothetical protein